MTIEEYWDVITQWMQTELVAGNNIGNIVSFLLILIGAWILGRIGKTILERIEKRLTEKHPIKAIGFGALGRGMVLIAIAIGVNSGFALAIVTSKDVGEFFDTVNGILLTIAFANLFLNLVDVPDEMLKAFSRRRNSKLDRMLAPIVKKSLRVTVIVFAGVQIAQILSGQSVSSIIAGLGIGGLAFALAAQDTIKNFFGSVVIFWDKPFELGDRIIYESHDGTIEEVGMRSTRIRRLDGHLVTIPNGELANKAIHNVARRPYIRRIINITVTYDTPPAKMREAKAILEELLKDHEGMREDFPPRIYFTEFNAASLNIMVIYWYFPPDYWAYMAFSENLNMQILERFNAAGIDFAFPTQTLYLAGDEKRPLEIGVKDNAPIR